MTTADLTGKRVLVLGAETALGSAITTALAEARAAVAAVAATNDAEAAFAVQRLARRLAKGERTVISQVIDATNEKAVQVMVRQVAKELGGLDAVVHCADRGSPIEPALSFAVRFGGRELARSEGTFVAVDVEPWEQPEKEMRPRFTFISFPILDLPQEEYVRWAVHPIAGAPDKR
jgi:NAD(P)-dependent dehydrogenase (short-subunit alcohol dehydrogenase family)